MRVVEAWEEAGLLHIQSELCDRGNLNDFLLLRGNPQAEWWQTVPEDQIWRYLLEMARALKHVHDCGMVHLDVKPSNFFVRADGSLALGDFGQAVDLSRLRDDDVEGDSVYMAPELLQSNLPANQRITPKADIFSLGATLLEIASGMNLPKNGEMWQKLRHAGEGVIRFSPSANRSGQLEQLINLMMEPEPS